MTSVVLDNEKENSIHLFPALAVIGASKNLLPSSPDHSQFAELYEEMKTHWHPGDIRVADEDGKRLLIGLQLKSVTAGPILDLSFSMEQFDVRFRMPGYVHIDAAILPCEPFLEDCKSRARMVCKGAIVGEMNDTEMRAIALCDRQQKQQQQDHCTRKIQRGWNLQRLGICRLFLVSILSLGQWTAVVAFQHPGIPSTQLRRAFGVLRASTASSTPASATPADVTLAADTTAAAANPLLFTPDPAFEEPLPPATACPFSGILGGPNAFYQQAWRELAKPKVFSYLQKGQPVVELTGGANIRSVMNHEYTKLQSNAVAGLSQKVCGTNSLRTAPTKAEHRALRQLVSAPLSASAVAHTIPVLQHLTEQALEGMVQHYQERPTKMEVVAERFALDITLRQLLGLELTTSEEIETFHERTHTWLSGMYSPAGSSELEACLQAREYLLQAMQEKINRLVQAGQSDGTVMGGLLYATVEDQENEQNNGRQLSHVEVMDNALLLILAGTEVTSSILACTILLLGLHPRIYRQLQAEQDALVDRQNTKDGAMLTQYQLDASQCPILDSVLNEALRLFPVTLVSRRKALETIVVDGVQIPKGWAVSYNIALTHQQDETTASSYNKPDNNNHMDLIEGFRPERWRNEATRPTTEFMPFGMGPRRCPGNVLAMTELKTFLALFARTLDFELTALQELEATNPDDSFEARRRRYLDEVVEWRPLNAVSIPLDGVPIVVRPRRR